MSQQFNASLLNLGLELIQNCCVSLDDQIQEAGEEELASLLIACKYPPAEPGALRCEPLKAA
jgi:hypothetical protein